MWSLSPLKYRASGTSCLPTYASAPQWRHATDRDEEFYNGLLWLARRHASEAVSDGEQQSLSWHGSRISKFFVVFKGKKLMLSKLAPRAPPLTKGLFCASRSDISQAYLELKLQSCESSRMRVFHSAMSGVPIWKPSIAPSASQR